MSIQEEIETQKLICDGYVTRYMHPHSSQFQKYLAKKIIKFTEPHGKILDNGCGPGYFCKNYLNDYKIIGVDISEDMLVHAKKNLNEAILGNSENLPFLDNYFDVIISRSLIHHLVNPQKGIDEVSRTLKPGGRALFIDPIATLASSLPRKLLNKTRFFSSEHKNFNIKELVKMIKKSGLKITRVEYTNYIGYAMVSAPDIFNPLKYLPFKSKIAGLLLFIDDMLSKIPLVNKVFALGVIIVCEKK